MFSKPGYAALVAVTETRLKKRKEKVENHTSNRPENSYKTVRLPFVNHVIVYPEYVKMEYLPLFTEYCSSP